VQNQESEDRSEEEKEEVLERPNAIDHEEEEEEEEEEGVMELCRMMEKHGTRRGKLQRRRSPISMRHVPISSTRAMICTKTRRNKGLNWQNSHRISDAIGGSSYDFSTKPGQNPFKYLRQCDCSTFIRIIATIVQGIFIFYDDPRSKPIPDRSPTL